MRRKKREMQTTAMIVPTIAQKDMNFLLQVAEALA
jgi:hypothetical protein